VKTESLKMTRSGFEDALRKVLSTPAHPSSKSAKRAAEKKPKRKK
jgi:hypothetical protein